MSSLEKAIGRNTVKYPMVTEKNMNALEQENKITFIVDKKATKKEIKEDVEREFNVKIEKINLLNDMKGRKKAIVKLKKEYKASDLATKLKMV